jgi:hypothetical protein
LWDGQGLPGKTSLRVPVGIKQFFRVDASYLDARK